MNSILLNHRIPIGISDSILHFLALLYFRQVVLRRSLSVLEDQGQKDPHSHQPKSYKLQFVYGVVEVQDIKDAC